MAIACWLPLFSVAKRTLPHLDAYALGTARYAIGVVLFVLLLVSVEGWAALRFEGRLLKAAGAGLLGITGFNLFVWVGLAHTRPEHASVIMALQTPMSVVFVWLWRRQRPAGFTLGCVATAILGVLLVVTRGDPARALGEVLEGGSLFGDALIFLGAASWAGYTLMASGFGGWSPLRFTVLTCLPGFAGLLVAQIVAIAFGAAAVPSVDALANVWWQLAYFSICTVVLGVFAFNAANRRLGPLNTMLMLNFLPIGVFLIEAALGMRFGAAELVGACLVIGALVANNLHLRHAAVRQF